MAIEFNCPHCATPYRLKDELAGKRATCKNTACRQVIVVPPPRGLSIAELGGIIPTENGKDYTPLPSAPVDTEAAALAALNDSPQQAGAAADTVPVVCAQCDHHWTEPVDKAGKNVLCPECRHRVKVPLPQKAAPPAPNWRTGASDKPTLAKENFEKPTDIVSSEGQVVSGAAWKAGGGADQDLDPIPLSRRLFFVALFGTPLLLLAAGAWYFWRSRTDDKLDRVMETALGEFTQDGAGEVPPPQAPLFAAILELAAGEYALREQHVNKTPAETLKMALDHFGKAREQIRVAAQKDDPKKPTTGERAVLAGELAVAQLGLGGTDEQAADGSRYSWHPSAPTTRSLRVNERTVTVHAELQRTLQLLQGADFDLKAAVARRLTRELVKRGQAELAVDAVVMLFPEPEQAEARAEVALEMYRLDRASEKARQLADDLKGQAATGRWNPFPASAPTLWLALGTEKAPTLTPAPQPPPVPVSDNTRQAYTGLYLLQGKAAEAVALAGQGGGTPAGQLRAYVLCAEWSADPAQVGAALDSAAATVSVQMKLKKDGSSLPPYLVLQLAQLAAAAGKTEQAKQLADALPDDGLKAWAKGDAVRLAATAESKSALDEAAAEVPGDPKQMRAGHAWGRLWLARQNARADAKWKSVKAVDGWPKGTVRPFGLAGIALGLQDK